jgi:two-component system chemotaxis response regulator CheY
MTKILAVDDSPTMLNMLAGHLRGAGHDVCVAKDGAEALVVMRKERPEIVITDLNMPQMDGLEFIEAARQEETGREIPLLLLTTETAEELKSRARRIGATGWLSKPFDPTQILNLVDQLA